MKIPGLFHFKRKLKLLQSGYAGIKNKFPEKQPEMQNSLTAILTLNSRTI